VRVPKNTAASLATTARRVIAEAKTPGEPFDAVGIATTGSVNTAEVVAAGSFFDGYADFSWRDALAEDLAGNEFHGARTRHVPAMHRPRVVVCCAS
jgi:hypothetical protein